MGAETDSRRKVAATRPDLTGGGPTAGPSGTAPSPSWHEIGTDRGWIRHGPEGDPRGMPLLPSDRSARETEVRAAAAIGASVDLLLREAPDVRDALDAAFLGSTACAAWWRPTVEREAGEHEDAGLIAEIHVAVLERIGDASALAALRALQIGAGPEWSVVEPAAQRLADHGHAEPRWRTPARMRVGRCASLGWTEDGRALEVLLLEVVRGHEPLGLATLVDPGAGGVVIDVLAIPVERLLALADQVGADVHDLTWLAPRVLHEQITTAIDRTDLLGVGPRPSSTSAVGYPALRGLLRRWSALAGEA